MESNGKAPLPTNGTKFAAGGPGGDKRLINVQPPRREDLQPAYAQTLQGESEDAGSHGWYGSMSMLPRRSLHPFISLTNASQYPRHMCRFLRCHPMLCRLPQPLQARQPRQRRPSHQIRSLLPRSRPRSRQDQPSIGETHPSRREDPNRWLVPFATSPYPS